MAHDGFGLVGMTLHGKYRVDEVIGEGGFGIVYKGRHLGFDEPIAIKCLKIPSHFTPEARQLFLERFREEGKLIFKLSHPGIVRVLDLGEETLGGGRSAHPMPFLILEWLSGETLEDYMYRKGPLREEEAMTILVSALEALAVAHRQNVAHRDIKPANLFLVAPGEIKILDFGIAKAMQDGESATQFTPIGAGEMQSQTSSGFSAFSPGFGAPEQFLRTRFGATGPWTDVHAMGLLLTQMLLGRTPYPTAEFGELLLLATGVDRPTPRRMGLQVRDGVEQIALAALAVNPANRPKDATALLAMVRDLVRDVGGTAPPNPGLPATKLREFTDPPQVRRENEQFAAPQQTLSQGQHPSTPIPDVAKAQVPTPAPLPAHPPIGYTTAPVFTPVRTSSSSTPQFPGNPFPPEALGSHGSSARSFHEPRRFPVIPVVVLVAFAAAGIVLFLARGRSRERPARNDKTSAVAERRGKEVSEPQTASSPTVAGSEPVDSATSVIGTSVTERTLNVSGRLPLDTVRRVIRANFTRYRTCYDAFFKKTGVETAEVALNFTIDKSGEVGAIATKLSYNSTTEPDSCTRGATAAMTFPNPADAATVAVESVLVFKRNVAPARR